MRAAGLSVLEWLTGGLVLALPFLWPDPASGQADTTTILERTPAHLRVDGDLNEWGTTEGLTRRPFWSVPLGKAAAPSEDLTARFRLTLDHRGLAFAGEVVDDTVLFPTTNKDRLQSDHVELWLAFPTLPIPPFEVDLSTGACGGEEQAATCRAWSEEQKLYESYVRRLFIHQYSFSSLGSAEHFASAGPAHPSFAVPFPASRSLEGAQTAFVRTATGYSFEAFLPIDSLPASSQLPITELRFLIDLVDNDAGFSGQETFLSMAANRRFGDPSTFLPARLAAPLRLGSNHDLAELVLGLPLDRVTLGRFFWPQKQLDEIFVALRLPHDGDDQPWRGSIPKNHPPFLLALPLTGTSRLLEKNSLEVHVLQSGAEVGIEGSTRPRFYLVSLREGRWLAAIPLEYVGDCVEDGSCFLRQYERDGVQQALIFGAAAETLDARGPGAAAPALLGTYFEVDPEGDLAPLLTLSLAGRGQPEPWLLGPESAGLPLGQVSTSQGWAAELGAMGIADYLLPTGFDFGYLVPVEPPDQPQLHLFFYDSKTHRHVERIESLSRIGPIRN